MSMLYKLLEASNEHGATYAFEELEHKVNVAARDGYRLKEQSIQIIREDRGNTQVPLCRVVAVMTKKNKEPKAPKELKTSKKTKKQEKQPEIPE